MRFTKTTALVIAIVLVIIAVFVFTEPLPQDPGYHRFADDRTLFGVPHFLNVVTSLALTLVGAAGLYRLMLQEAPGIVFELRTAYLTFFIGVTLTGLGSAWYHLDPDTSRLLWDRLPMSIGFMALLGIIIGENISATTARRLLLPLILAGIASVLYWHFTEQAGRGDLRAYVLVQFIPVLMIPIILVMYPSSFSNNDYVWGLLLAYVLAKIAETLDAQIFSLLGMISGHSLKHLLAAFGVFLFYLAIKRRVPVAG